MERIEKQIVVVTYRSSLHPEIVTSDENAANYAIAWADERPVAWDVVRSCKSAARGRSSSKYMGCERGDSPSGALSRVRTLRSNSERDDLFGWSARFTMEHYRDKGFRGGFFRQFDGQYDRGAAVLDYTPDTLDEVISRFVEWCGSTFHTASVKIDDKVVRTFEQSRGNRS